MATAGLPMLLIGAAMAAGPLSPTPSRHGDVVPEMAKIEVAGEIEDGGDQVQHPGFREAETGRLRLFHGLPLVYKEASPAGQWTHAQLDLMVTWGFSAARLGFVWHLYETAPGVYNETYMDEVELLADALGARGIYVYLDMHQDNWAPCYCGGHGVPAFWGDPEVGKDPAFRRNGKKAYPEPLAQPTYPASTNGTAWWPIDDCSNASKLIGWPSSYVSFALSKGAQRLYTAGSDAQVAFQQFWIRVAKRFGKKKYLLAYELINEPWVGDIYADPDLLLPGQADKKNLQGLYSALHTAIRTVDNDTILMYEPSTGGNLLGAPPSGLAAGPGGHGYDSKQALSYHVYCPLLETDVPGGGSGNEQADLEVCKYLNQVQYDVRVHDTIRLNTAGFMTEFGANTHDRYGWEYVRTAMDAMDAVLHSWSYWYFTPDPANKNGNLIERNTLTRPHAQAIAGRFVSSQALDNATGVLRLAYTGAIKSPAAKVTTEIFVCVHDCPGSPYERGVECGFDCTFGSGLHAKGCAANITADPARNLIIFEHENGADVEIRIGPLGAGIGPRCG